MTLLDLAVAVTLKFQCYPFSDVTRITITGRKKERKEKKSEAKILILLKILIICKHFF